MSAEPTASRSTPATPAPPEDAHLGDDFLLRVVRSYLSVDEVALVEHALAYLREHLTPRADTATDSDAPASTSDPAFITNPLLDHTLALAQTLAEVLHVDAVTLAAVLLYPLVASHEVSHEASLDAVRQRLGAPLGEQVARSIASLERFDTLQRPAADLRRSAQKSQKTLSEQGEESRERRRARERQRQIDADALRKMFVALAEDPRIVLIKLGDQLRHMRSVRDAADQWRVNEAAQALADSTAATATDGTSASQESATPSPPLSLDECQIIAQETRDVYAPLAGRLGLSLVESELDDLAFAVLEPEEFARLSAAVAAETSLRRDYVDRVCAILREEVAKLGIRAEVSGRIKHLYSIYKKVRRSGTFDLSNLYDILAFRIIVGTEAECYEVLGHVHELWRPKEGRIKDFIASPKPNGYQSLHTTVFCLDGRLAEIQIRTWQMHQAAEYGVAMHWYYKDVGDSASAKAKSLQAWMRQVREWQRELSAAARGDEDTVQQVTGDVLKEQIYVFTPAGDAKELPAGATPLDFAYRIHTGLGNHVAGVRITSEEGGRLMKKLVPLDYELRNGDVVQIIKRNSAHPTRDWLRVAKTKTARDHIQRYLKLAEREQYIALGRERLERELVALGLKHGLDDLEEGDAQWLVQEFGHKTMENLLVGIGSERLRLGTIVGKLRDRLRIPVPEAPAAEETPAPSTVPAPAEGEFGASVQGMTGMLMRLATCCSPIPGDALLGYVTRGRGIVVHRADCPSLRHLMEREPERVIAVSWPRLEGHQTFHVPVHIEGTDRLGMTADISGTITARNINMSSFEVQTRKAPARAIITAVLELERPDQLDGVLHAIRQVQGVYLAERKQPRRTSQGAPGDARGASAAEGSGRKGRKG